MSTPTDIYHQYYGDYFLVEEYSDRIGDNVCRVYLNGRLFATYNSIREAIYYLNNGGEFIDYIKDNPSCSQSLF